MQIKTAQFKLTNIDSIQPFRKNRRGNRHIMPDISFERFLVSLRKVHEALSSGASIEGSLSFFTDGISRRAGNEIIRQIGLESFSSMNWGNIESVLRFYRTGEGAMDEEEEILPGQQQQNEETIESVEESIPESESSELISAGEYQGLTKDQMDKVEEYKHKEYGSSEVIQQNVKKMLDRLIGGFRKINDPNVGDFEKSLAMSSHIEVAMELLDQWHEEYLERKSVTQEQETEKEEAFEESEEVKPTEEKPKVKVQLGEKDEAYASVENDAREQGVKKTYPSEASDDEALRATGLELNEDYFSIQDGNLEVNSSVFADAYKHSQELFRQWAGRAIRRVGNAFKPPAPEVINQLNTIVHGIRVFDYGVYLKFSEYILKIDKAIETAESKEEQKRLILLKKNLIRQRGTKLERNFISFKLSQDTLFADSISTPLLYASSYAAFVNMTFAREKFINKDDSKLSSSIKNDPQATQIFIDSINKRSILGIVNSFKKFWRLDIRDLNPDTSRDIIAFMNISAVNYFTGAVSDANSRQKGLKSFNTTNCPSCHRVIEFHVGGSLSKEEAYNGFDLGNYAPYIKSESGYQMLVEDDFRYLETGEERRFGPPGKEYINQTKPGQSTLIAINDIDESHKTWDEINSMINSENYEIQREGMLRRAEAYRQMGASFKGSTNINSKKFLCPMGKHKTQFDTNKCGLKMKEPEGASRAYHLQPSWNGSLPEIISDNGKFVKQYNNEFFKPNNWSDQELAQVAESKGQGGYKFSKIMFGCPCHIHSPDPSDEDLWLQYSNVAFRIKDNFTPPTKPNGSFADIDPETRAYLVCSSNVSLSSVDRDPSSSTFILKYLKELYDQKSDHYIMLIDFLATNGFDEIDLLQMIEDISAPNINSKASKLSQRIHDRINKLEEILVKNAVFLGSSTMEAIRGITLVCPFGHRFTVEQSLKFGESHGSFKLYNKKVYKQVSSLIGTSGRDNLESFKDFLVPYSDLGTQKAAYYDEWIKLPASKRKINFWKQTASEVVLLKFNIDDQDFVFGNKVSVRQEPIWNGSGTRKFDRSQIERQIYNEGMVVSGAYGGIDSEGQQLNQIENIGEEAGKIQGAGEAYKEARTEWEMVMSQILDYDIEEEYHVRSPAIPGGSRQYQNAANIIGNMDSLNRSLVGAFNIMHTWTANLIHENLGESFARQYLEEEKLREMADIVFDQSLRNIIDFEFIGDQDEDDYEAEIESSMNRYKQFFGDIFIDNAQISSLIRKGDLSESETAKKIIQDALMDFISKYENIELTDNVIPGEGLENADPNLLSSAASKLIRHEVAPAKNRFSQPETLGQRITIFNDKTATKDVQGFGKLTLVAYAKFVASAIYKMQSLFFTKSSPLYVGYNPLLKQYASPDDILRISKEDIERINVSWGPKSNLIESPHTIYDSVAEIDEFGPKYLAMINKAYQFLDMHVKNARSLVITPKSIQAAKEYIQEEMGDRYLAEYLQSNPDATPEEARSAVKRRQSLVDRALPIHSSKFSKMVSTYEKEEVVMPDGKTSVVSKYSPYNVFPYFPISKQKKSNDLTHPFYAQLQIETDPSTGRKVLTDPQRGYNSGKVQVGAITRPTIRQWPMPKFGFYGEEKGRGNTTTKNHVGLPLPIYGDYRSNQISELRDLLVFNLRPVIDIPVQVSDEENGVSISNAKVDVSFLLERGFSKEHYRMIYNLYEELSQVKRIWNEEKERINGIENTHPKIIDDLEEQMKYLEMAISKNQDRPGYKNKVMIDQRQLDVLKVKHQRYVDELENIDQLKKRLQSWYDKNLDRIQNEFSGLPVNINTKKDFYHMKDSASNLDSIEDGSFAPHRKKVGKMMPAGVLHVGFADPILAYKLIMSPEFHGSPYISLGEERIPNEEAAVKNALIDFIVGVYNLDQIARMFAKRNAKALKANGYNLFEFSGRDLLIGTVEKRFESEDFAGVAYTAKDFMPGNYYDLSLEDSSISLYSDSESDKIPTYKELIFASKKAKFQGISRPFEERSASNNLITVSHRAAEAMEKYIRTITQGDMPDSEDNQASDQTLEKNSKLYEKILKRSLSLQRIMIMQAAGIIDPANLL